MGACLSDNTSVNYDNGLQSENHSLKPSKECNDYDNESNHPSNMTDENKISQPDLPIFDSKITMAHETKFSQADLTIFDSQITPSNECNDHKKCPSLLRLCATLEYYAKLDIQHKPQNNDIFYQFIKEIHTNILDDYTHFIKTHGHQIEDIHNDWIINNNFQICQMSKCQYSSRHHNHYYQSKPPKHGKKEDNNALLKFYEETMDSLHYYVFHIFESGLRTLTSAIDNDEINEEKKDDEYFDAQFARIRNEISQTDKNTNLFTRFGRNTTSKFTINTQFDEKNIDEYITNDAEDEIDTFLDALYQHMLTQGVDEEDIYKLYEYIQIEKYETESVSMDLFEIGNISILFKFEGEKVVESAVSFFKKAKSIYMFIFVYYLSENVSVLH